MDKEPCFNGGENLSRKQNKIATKLTKHTHTHTHTHTRKNVSCIRVLFTKCTVSITGVTGFFIALVRGYLSHVLTHKTKPQQL